MKTYTAYSVQFDSTLAERIERCRSLSGQSKSEFIRLAAIKSCESIEARVAAHAPEANRAVQAAVPTPTPTPAPNVALEPGQGPQEPKCPRGLEGDARLVPCEHRYSGPGFHGCWQAPDIEHCQDPELDDPRRC